MKKILSLALVAVCALVLCSCATKQSAYNDLRDLTNELQYHSDSYSSRDWKIALYKYQRVNSNLRKHSYTNEEMEEIGVMQGQCAGVFTQALAHKVTGIVGMLKGFASGFTDQLNLDELLGK